MDFDRRTGLANLGKIVEMQIAIIYLFNLVPWPESTQDARFGTRNSYICAIVGG
jgi:hypothetical protein